MALLYVLEQKYIWISPDSSDYPFGSGTALKIVRIAGKVMFGTKSLVLQNKKNNFSVTDLKSFRLML